MSDRRTEEEVLLDQLDEATAANLRWAAKSAAQSKEIETLRAALKLEAECMEQMTMAANQLHKELYEDGEPCPLCADRSQRDKDHCSLCSGTGCVNNGAVVTGLWALVAWPRTTGEGEEYLALPGQYETRAGAELAAEMAARIQKRTVMVVKRL